MEPERESRNTRRHQAGSVSRRSFAWNLLVQRQIELQDVHTRFPEEAQRASRGVLHHQVLHLLG